MINMQQLSGHISDRVRSGEIPAAYLNKPRVLTEDEAPTPEWILRARGVGMGGGAGAARNERD